MKLSVVIPARNEGANVGETIGSLVATLDHEVDDFEIVVVDDGSADATPQVVEECRAADGRIRLVRNAAPHGFGRAVRKGIEAVLDSPGCGPSDGVVICMADGSDDPADVVRYYRILNDKAECAFGSRFVKGARVRDYPRFKLVINRLANWFIKLLFGIPYNDVTNAFKGYRTSVLRGCQPLLSPHFNLTVELPLKAIVRGYSYTVLPISWRSRRHGVSALHLEEQGSRYLFVVLIVWLEKLLTKGDYRRRDVRPNG